MLCLVKSLYFFIDFPKVNRIINNSLEFENFEREIKYEKNSRIIANVIDDADLWIPIRCQQSEIYFKRHLSDYFDAVAGLKNF